MDFEERKINFQDADRRYAELKRQYDAGAISTEEFDTQLRKLRVQDDEGRLWAKSRETGEWHWVVRGAVKHYGELPGKSVAPPPRAYSCPEGDYVWYQHSARNPVPECPNHHVPLERSDSPYKDERGDL